MIITRRKIVLGAAALTTMAACAPTAPPASLAVSASGAAGMNPGPDGSDRPLTVRIIQMSGTAAFDSADFFALQDPQTALGAEFVGQQQVGLAPGGTASAQIAIQPGVVAVGFVAGFRDPSGKVFRRRIAAPTGPGSALVSVTRSGLSVQAG